jgi:hypothetical protein
MAEAKQADKKWTEEEFRYLAASGMTPVEIATRLLITAPQVKAIAARWGVQLAQPRRTTFTKTALRRPRSYQETHGQAFVVGESVVRSR